MRKMALIHSKSDLNQTDFGSGFDVTEIAGHF